MIPFKSKANDLEALSTRSTMDEATANLALALQVEDLDRLLKTTPTNQPKTTEPDSRVALIAYRDEVASKLHIFRDRRMSPSIAQAVQNDGRAIFEARSQENQAVRDRRTAEAIDTTEHLQNGERPRTFNNLARPREIIDLTDNVDDDRMRRLATVNNGAPGFIDLTPRPRLTLGQQLRRKRSREGNTFKPAQSDEAIIGVKKTCASCNDPVLYFEAVYAPCGHEYCKVCVNQLFSLAARDESVFPPRCCKQSIPLAAADVFFTPEFVKEFGEKPIEYTTPNRTYCAWPACSVFIPQNQINNDVGVCPSCSFWTCTMCKSQSHAGRDCPQDTALNSLVETARQAGWQRCYHCRRFVELTRGCNHMTYVLNTFP